MVDTSMENIHLNKPAPPSHIKLYVFIGEAISTLQYIENALSRYIVIKIFGKINKAEADQHLKKNRAKTLGQEFKIIKEQNLFPEIILNKLEILLEDRNWLVHRSFDEIQDEIEMGTPIEDLFIRIKSISTKAGELINLIDSHMIEYCESNGADMTRTRKAAEEYYSKI